MAGCIPTASCGCVSAAAVCCSERACPVSACPTCAVEGRDEVFLGEGALGMLPGLVVPGPVSLAFEPFAHCAGVSATGERCAKWLCGEHVEDGYWGSACNNCEDNFCDLCADKICCEVCYKTLCNKCNEDGEVICCARCEMCLCKEHDTLTCSCGKSFCDFECVKNTVCGWCTSCSAFSCSECMESDPPPLVSCSSCDATTCAPCRAKFGTSACDGCGSAYCASAACQARLVGHCDACETRCCARCTCAACAATLCACAPEALSIAKCAQCRQRHCTVCLDRAACCGRVLCAACGEGGACSECGKSTCSACSDGRAHEGCSSKRSRAAE